MGSPCANLSILQVPGNTALPCRPEWAYAIEAARRHEACLFVGLGWKAIEVAWMFLWEIDPFDQPSRCLDLGFQKDSGGLRLDKEAFLFAEACCWSCAGQQVWSFQDQHPQGHAYLVSRSETPYPLKCWRWVAARTAPKGYGDSRPITGPLPSVCPDELVVSLPGSKSAPSKQPSGLCGCPSVRP